jgi:tRNA pseudouridine32 synthase/23S rRNA pseudouridine746 synthase
MERLSAPVDLPDPMDRWTEIRNRNVIAEDDHILVLNKPPGISVVGERHEADLMTLAGAAGEWLMPVHRIDKVTSGVILLAKTIEIHGSLTRQFNRRTVDKAYLAITRSRGLPERGVIDLPLAEGRKNKVRVAAPRESIVLDETTQRWSVPRAKVLSQKRNYPSLTAFARLWESERRSLLLLRPVTGRRHQIRVHLAWIGHPVEGDPLFASDGHPARTFLHAWRLGFDAPWDDDSRIQVEAPPDPGFWKPLGRRAVDEVPGPLLQRAMDALPDLESLETDPTDHSSTSTSSSTKRPSTRGAVEP